MKPTPILPPDWNPQAAADRVLAGLHRVTRPEVKGAHDAYFVAVGERAYVIYMANEVQPGEAPHWPFVYCALSVVSLNTGAVERTVTVAASGMKYENATLPVGACFVPRLMQKDAQTLRCYFTSEDPGKRQSQTWYIDYDLGRQEFIWRIQPMLLSAAQGTFPMQPCYFYAHQKAKGFALPEHTHGLYMIDGFKQIDGRIMAVMNNFPIGQNALVELNASMDGVTVIGDFFEPVTAKLTESAVQRLPDGSWLAISRQEAGDRNYLFASSPDGRTWSPHAERPVVKNGTNSKPALECFGGVYYLGWQEATKVNGAFRSVFNLEVSRDGVHWERKYRFATDKSFQYPTFREHQGAIYLTVTQGDHSDSRKEWISFGKLE